MYQLIQDETFCLLCIGVTSIWTTKYTISSVKMKSLFAMIRITSVWRANHVINSVKPKLSLAKCKVWRTKHKTKVWTAKYIINQSIRTIHLLCI